MRKVKKWYKLKPYHKKIGDGYKMIINTHQENVYPLSTPLLYSKTWVYRGKPACTCDSSSLTNEKDHHYFLNSADVCW